jgi:hypothetical protein
VGRSDAFASAKVQAKRVPCTGIRGTPFTVVGTGSPVASTIVGATSMACVNWLRGPPDSLSPP